MANYWAIEIGISQYRFLPPLSYAQRDAELLHQVLLEAGFAAQRCSLLCEQITQTATDPGLPSKANIQAVLARFQPAIQPEDLLICFFSGYGVQHQGKDYLLPIEANPQQIPETGLAVVDLLNGLQASSSQNIVLLLDANRSQPSLPVNQSGFGTEGFSTRGFGAETLRLAQDLDIAVLLSCQPDQASHEPLTLRQGIFTAALAAALGNCITLEQLVSQLSQLLPQLSEEFWRSRQDLQAFMPVRLRYRLILPESGAVKPALKVLAGGKPQQTPDWQHDSTQRDYAMSSSYATSDSANTGRAGLLQTLSALWSQTFPGASDATSRPAAEPLSAGAATLTFSEGLDAGLSDQFFWRRLLAQGSLIAGILLFGVILRNSSSLINSADLPVPTTQSQAQNRSQNQSQNQPQALVTNPSGNSSGNLTIQSSANSTGASAASVTLPATDLDPTLLMQAAQSAFQAQQYDEANRQLIQIPVAQRSPEQQQLLEQVNQELLNQAKTMLIRTRSPMSENQVSDLVEAIKVARLIKPDQPLYAEAQQSLDRWSRLIMDMAQGRAERANGSSAIDAADNYTKAIAAARLVPDDQVVHSQAQQAVSLWSKKILDLANIRASNGELDLAIQIGELVPPNTPDYAAAQEAIASWRNQPSPTSPN